ncbi:MAG: nucleotidyltransferase domain-containing protein [Gaiellaceae bacterium]
MNDLAFVERAISLLASKGVDAWVFGGWGEELRGLITPREHVDLDLLHPAEDWSIVDNLYLDWIDEKRFDWKRAFRLEGVLVELFLVQHDERGWYTQLERRRHNWPTKVFAGTGRIPVASTAALAGYRHSYRIDARDVA